MKTISRRTALTTGLLGALSLPLALRPAGPDPKEKELWARSFLGKKGPALVVEKWLGPEPKTENRWVLIDFWATWCGPCRKAIPELNGFHAKFGDRLVVIGISDEPEATVAAFNKPAIEYFKAIDTRARTKKRYEVRGIPHVVILDPEGIVRWEGYPLLEGYQLTEAVVEKLLPPPASK